MKIQGDTVTIHHSIQSLELRHDGSMTVTLLAGYDNAGVFTATSSQRFEIDAGLVGSMLDNIPNQGMTRRQDIDTALYTYFIDAGLIAGTIVQ